MLKRIISKPHYLFLFSGLLWFGLFHFHPSITGTDFSFDIAIHDTYYIIASFHVAAFVFLFHLVFFLFYFLADKYSFLYSRLISFIHFFICLFFFSANYYTIYQLASGSGKSSFYNQNNLYGAIHFFLLLQLLPLLNMALHLVYRKKNSR
ncbi:MAG: hypothetical protein ACOZCO_15215 [Bacteroidota bacterium]